MGVAVPTVRAWLPKTRAWLHVCVQGVAQFISELCQQVYHGDESQDAKMCKLHEVWATSKGPLCEILHALFCGQRKVERQRFIWELKRQSRERGEREEG